MKSTPEDRSRLSSAIEHKSSKSLELEALIKRRMKAKALRRSREVLKQKVTTATLLNASLNAILTFEAGGKSRTRLVESA